MRNMDISYVLKYDNFKKILMEYTDSYSRIRVAHD